jgi:hypothetical protein
MHLDDGILGEEDLLTHYVDLGLHILITPNGVIQVHFLVSQQVVHVTAGYLLLVEILL